MKNMVIFICDSCKVGFDIEVSGGIDCPECGGRRWKAITKLPKKAEPYRLQWMKEFDVCILNEGEKPEDFFDVDGNSKEDAREIKTGV